MVGTIDPRPPPSPPSGAFVTPRGRSDVAGDILPIADLLQPWIERGAVGAIRLAGPARSGKSVALAHLKTSRPDRPDLVWLDDPLPAEVSDLSGSALVIFASRNPLDLPVLATFEMADWGDDDAIEYLLAVHRSRHESVMRRLLADPARHALLDGSPELWRATLDELAADEGVADVLRALAQRVERLAPGVSWREDLGRRALRGLSLPPQGSRRNSPRRLSTFERRLLRSRPFKVVLASDFAAAALESMPTARQVLLDCPLFLVPEIARRVPADGAHRAILDTILERRESLPHPAAATLRLALTPTWRPPSSQIEHLAGARLAKALWSGLDLVDSILARSDLTEADLSNADLRSSDLRRTILRHGRLEGAKLTQADAQGADFTGAFLSRSRLEATNLSGATLRSATLVDAYMSQVILEDTGLEEADLKTAILARSRLRRTRLDGANLEGVDLSDAFLMEVDFREARLVDVNFTRARLHQCNFEGVVLPAAKLWGADLTGSDLSDTQFRRGDLRGSSLCETGLAGVAWEGADLRGADFTGASFHMGSSRSGLLFSPIASEGSRTGYYTDESAEQDFRAPEEIRKANLCGADLCSAKVMGTDWYLVDLRGAKYTPDQREHFARCGAILVNRKGPGRR